jgi:hypothetical protein
MTKQLIVPIVEGFGEEKAVPILVRHWLEHRHFDRCFDVPDCAVNAKGCGKLKAPHDPKRHLGIEHYVASALRGEPDAILIILDADKECLHRSREHALGPELLERARRAAGPVPVAVVVANRTYEAWLLAGRSALARCSLVLDSTQVRDLEDPERRAGAKSVMGTFIGETYSPPVHQHELTHAMSFSPGSQARAPSLGKLLRELDRLTREARQRRSR